MAKMNPTTIFLGDFPQDAKQLEQEKVNPMGKYDLCWLPQKPLSGIGTYYLDEKASGPICEGIRREIERSFGAGQTARAEAALVLRLSGKGGHESFQVEWNGGKTVVCAPDEAGLLYGLYAFIREKTRGMASLKGQLSDAPVNSIRMLNHWDNFSGDIERGYAGKSIFYNRGRFIHDKDRIEDYARLLASIGINGISLNNVNVRGQDLTLLREDNLEKMKVYCNIFLAYGIKPFMSVNFASPMLEGGLDTADPLSPAVSQWWAQAVQRIYRIIPGFGGFLVKADSEGEPGPYSYGRSHAEGANMFADALAPYGGRVIWRCFVYNYKQDWRDRSTDRAKAAYENFYHLDGQFRPNATLQIKFGPLDFQIREPVSPLIGAMPNTNIIVEMQITQEYTGHQLHLCYLVPQWCEVMSFDTRAGGEENPVWRLTGGKPGCGMAAVGSVGRDANWTGHKLAQANLYGFGRLAWNPLLSAGEVLREWMEQTFSLNEALSSTLYEMMLNSRKVYEDYTVPLGVCFMCRPGGHYGPSVDGYEYDRWGTYHFADRNGLGNDRTQKTGTGFTAQYNEPNRSLYENLETCPDELLLFFHHVPYTHVLHSGKKVIQHIYDSHFDGCQKTKEYLRQWEAFKGSIPEEDYENVLLRLLEQRRSAREWRDQVNTYFFRKSGIPDEQGRTIYP